MSWASDLRSSLTPFQCEREACLTRTLGGLLLCPQWWVCVCRCFLCWVLPLLGGSACGGSHLLSGSMCGCAPCSGGSVCGVLPVLVGLCVGVLPRGGSVCGGLISWVGLCVGVSSPRWVCVLPVLLGLCVGVLPVLVGLCVGVLSLLGGSVGVGAPSLRGISVGDAPPEWGCVGYYPSTLLYPLVQTQLCIC